MQPSEQVLAEIQAEFPSFRLVPKAGSLLSRCLDVVLKVVTLGGQRSYLQQYHTVIGTTLYVPDSWSRASEVDRAIVLCHERVHLRQFRRYGWPLMTFLYLVPWLPLGLAYGRARLEWEAYAETLRATAEYRGVRAALDPGLRRTIVRRFVGGAYGFMWPFPRQVERWFDQVAAELGGRSGQA
jgi:hypothetical protein